MLFCAYRWSAACVMCQVYMRPLKQPENSPLVDPSLVDEMFYQIPEILDHHEHFLDRVMSCVNDWHDKQTVGHLLVESVSVCALACDTCDGRSDARRRTAVRAEALGWLIPIQAHFLLELSPFLS